MLSILLVLTDIHRREAQLEGDQKAPPPDVLVDYNYNVAERRSIHVLKTLQEDQTEGKGTRIRGSSVSGPATVRRRKKRRKNGSSASDSSGQSSIEQHTSAEPGSGQKYLRVDPARQRPKSATLTREKPAMDAQQQLMQPRTPPLMGSYRLQAKYHRRVMSSNQAGLEEQAAAYHQANNAASPNMYQATDGKTYTLPMVHKARMEAKHTTEGPMIPLDPRKDVLSDIEGTLLLFLSFFNIHNFLIKL